MKLTPEQIGLLNKIEDVTTKNHEILDKVILSMSSVFIGIIVGFSKEIKNLSSELPLKIAMLLVLFLFALTIIATLASYKVATYEGRYAQENIYHQQQVYNITKLTKFANIMENTALFCFVFGLLAIFMFFVVLFFPGLV